MGRWKSFRVIIIHVHISILSIYFLLIVFSYPSSIETNRWSSRGPSADGRIKPDVMAGGVYVWGADPGSRNPPEPEYAQLSGTSMSAPLVAGSAVLILQAHPEYTPAQVSYVLRVTASRAINPDNHYGYGIIDVWKAINYALTERRCEQHCLHGTCHGDNTCHCDEGNQNNNIYEETHFESIIAIELESYYDDDVDQSGSLNCNYTLYYRVLWL